MSRIEALTQYLKEKSLITTMEGEMLIEAVKDYALTSDIADEGIIAEQWVKDNSVSQSTKTNEQ